MLNRIARALATRPRRLRSRPPARRSPRRRPAPSKARSSTSRARCCPGVTATLTGPRGAQTAVTDAEGIYRFVGVQPATYILRIEMTGFAPQERTDVAVGLGRTVTTDFTLAIKGQTETVEVSGGRVAGRRPQRRHRHLRVEPDAADDAAVLIDGDRSAERRSRHQQQLRLRRAGALWQRAAARRRRHARSRRRLGLDLLQPEPDRGDPDRRPRARRRSTAASPARSSTP